MTVPNRKLKANYGWIGSEPTHDIPDGRPQPQSDLPSNRVLVATGVIFTSVVVLSFWAITNAGKFGPQSPEPKPQPPSFRSPTTSFVPTSPEPPATPSRVKPKTDFDFDLLIVGRRRLKDSLKDPSSLTIVEEHIVRPGHYGSSNGYYAKYRATNSFGGVVTDEFYTE